MRYLPQIKLPGFGLQAQEALGSSSVLIVGLGGLGNPAAMYLAGAGVGHIGLADYDIVSESNLHRQVAFGETEARTRQGKAETMAQKLSSLNSTLKIDTYPFRLNAQNATDIIKEYQIVLDCTDNTESRYALNRICAVLHVPLLYAAVHCYEGQISLFHFENGPCLNCLYPEKSAHSISCTEAGVLGPVPGIMGLMQAIETIKIITCIGENLSGYLLFYDALKQNFRKLRIPRNPTCEVCGRSPQAGDVNPTLTFTEKPIAEIDLASLLGKLKINPESYCIVNVSEKGYLPGSMPEEFQGVERKEIPLSSWNLLSHDLPLEKTLVLLCERGNSAKLALSWCLGKYKAVLLRGGWAAVGSL